MNKILVEIFDSETAAFESVNALREFHAAGDTFLHELAILLKDGTGKITVKKVDNEHEPTGNADGLGGAVGGMAWILFNLLQSGNSVPFFDEVSKTLASGKTFVIADMTSRINQSL